MSVLSSVKVPNALKVMLLGSAMIGVVLQAKAGDLKAIELQPASEVASLAGVAFNAKLAAMLPSEVKAAGVLKVATDLTPPISFHSESNDLVGIDADLAAALGVILGVKVEMTDVGMGAAIVPSIKSKRFDLSISGINDDVELEKQLDVIDYMFDATTIMTRKGNPQKIASLADLCGKTVAVPVGTFQERMVEAASAKCTVPINVMTIPKMPDVLQAVRTARADATVNGYATSVYTTEHQTGNGTGLEALRDVRLAVGYLGMLTSKDKPELRDALVGGLQQLVDSGAYKAIMTRWGLAPLAVEKVKFNDAASMPIE